MSLKFKMKKSSKFLLVLGSISVLIILLLIVVKCNEFEVKKDKDSSKFDIFVIIIIIEIIDVNLIVKDLKDVLILFSDSKKDDILKKLKEDSSKYIFWYDRKDYNIVIIEGIMVFFGKVLKGKNEFFLYLMIK